jgi:adenylate cyclase
VPSIADFEAAGLYDPTDVNRAERLEYLRWLSNRGFTIEDMLAAMERRSWSALAGDRLLVPGERLSRAEVIARTGLDGDAYDALVAAFGFTPIPGAPDGEVGITAEEAAMLAAFQELGSLFTPEEAMSFLRVVGSSLGRIADAALSLFALDVEDRVVAAGATELELAQLVEHGIRRLDGLAGGLDPVLRRQFLQAAMRSRHAAVPGEPHHRLRYAVGFVDLVGFTELTRRLDGIALSQLIRDFEARSFEAVRSAGAYVVKLIGDEVMFASTGPDAACRAAMGLIDAFSDPADEHVVPRGGATYGEVLMRGGDYFGSTVNLASRLADEAVPGEILVDEALAASATSCAFAPAGRRMVKGFADPIAVSSLVSV